MLGVIDGFTYQCLVLEVATGFPSRFATSMLERAIAQYGKPQSIRRDNGPELTPCGRQVSRDAAGQDLGARRSERVSS